MSIIEQATKRLEQLERAGVVVPWALAGLARSGAPGALREGSGTQDTDVEANGLNSVGALGQVARERSGLAIEPDAFRGRAARQAPELHLNVDLQRLRKEGYLVPDEARSQVAIEFRHLKRSLLTNARPRPEEPEHRRSLVMVTSAMPGEGKTFCAISLAMSMAMEVDTGVILVDADVVRPTLFKRLGVEVTPPGLLDHLLREDLRLDQVLATTNVPKLTLMAAGNTNERSTELLASNAMERLLKVLATDYADHIVIFDAPPLLLTTESAVLATKVGQVVMVVEALKTPRKVVREAFDALSDCPLVLSVLNKCEATSAEYRRYGYYFG
jgi:receptor protein-tyrosine kinase